jgi:hypothetical protein
MEFEIKGLRVFLFEFVTWIHPRVPVTRTAGPAADL